MLVPVTLKCAHRTNDGSCSGDGQFAIRNDIPGRLRHCLGKGSDPIRSSWVRRSHLRQPGAEVERRQRKNVVRGRSGSDADAKGILRSCQT